MPSDDDDDYANFVAAMWRLPGINLKRIRVHRLTAMGASECVLMRLIQAEDRRVYINALEAGERKTFAGDGRHQWKRDGKEFDSSAFSAIALGADPEIVLRHEPHPQSALAAMQPENDRCNTTDRRFLICYQNSKGELSCRVISRIIRQRDTFSARCHFRWGDRRTFLYEGLKAILDMGTGEIIAVETFRGKRRK